MTWKQVECPFERDRKILQYLLTVPVFSEDGEPHELELPPAPLDFTFRTLVCKGMALGSSCSVGRLSSDLFRAKFLLHRTPVTFSKIFLLSIHL